MLNKIPGLSCDLPNGAFYVFVKCSDLIGRQSTEGKIIKNDMDFAMYLMEEAGVAVVPGSGFLVDGFIRISYASSEDNLKDACSRINQAVMKLSGPPND